MQRGFAKNAWSLRGSKENHDRIVNETLILLGKEAHHLCRVWPNETGVAYRYVNGKKHWIAYGLKGSSDIIGLMNNGRWLSIEIKSGNATQQENQKRFEAMINDMGGVYFVARSAQDALDFILRLANFSRK